MHIMSSKHREGPHNHQHTTPKPRQDPLTSPTPNTSRPILRHMLIHTMCRSCLGSGTRVDIYAHTTYGRIGVKVWVYKGDVMPTRNDVTEATLTADLATVGD